MPTTAYSTVTHDSHADEAGTIHGQFARGAARMTGGSTGRDRVCVGARPEGHNAEERKAPERHCAWGAGLEVISDFRGDTFRAVYT